MRATLPRRKYVLTVAFLLLPVVPASAAIHEVIVRNFEFDPATITAVPGDTVRWIWESGSHTVTSGTSCAYDGLYFNQVMDSVNTQFDFVIPEGTGDIPYFCQPHCLAGMTGLITVEEVVAEFQITLDGDQLVPAVATPGSGSGTAVLTDVDRLIWEISYADLEGAVIAAHFHGAAPACDNAGVQIGLTVANPIVGSQVLTAQQVLDLLAGLWYVNIHTDLHMDGEIRGQVMPAPLLDPLPDPIPTGDTAVYLQTLSTGLTAPNWGAVAPGHPQRIFVSDQDGILWAVDLDTGSKSVFLDVSSRLVALGVFGPGTFDERGFLGVAFHPEYATNGLLYTYTSEPVDGPADFSTMPFGEMPNHQSVIAEWQVPNPGDPGSVVDPNSRREVLRIDEPQFNHNAGCLDFGPDGLLYVALGDGGSGDDRDGQLIFGSPTVGHGCLGNGADSETILGAVVRIDPDGTNSANGNYGIPADNPFVDRAGLDEIYAYGFRNPFRFSFDPLTGEMYVADVGQNDVEEIDVVTAGGNYGWRYKEGSFYFVFNGNQPGYVTDMPLEVPPDLVDPIAEYDHNEGTAIVGGFVYRGSNVPQLEGRYVFGEFARTFSNDGRLFYLDENAAIREFELLGRTDLGMSLLGFGRDAAGELYVLANATGVPFDETGVVLRITRILGDMNCDGIVNSYDIDGFICALSPGCNYEATYLDCDRTLADVNGDGVENSYDIDGFIAIIGGG